MAPSRNEWTPDPGLLAGRVALIAGGAGGIFTSMARRRQVLPARRPPPSVRQDAQVVRRPERRRAGW